MRGMRIKGEIVMEGEEADIIVKALMPDNIDKDEKGARAGKASFEADKIGTMIATIDDYLMNARIAKDIIEVVKGEKGEG